MIADELAFQVKTYERIKSAQKQPDVQKMRRALDGEYPPRFVYPELENRTLVSLLWELAFLCDNPGLGHAFRDDARTFSDAYAIGSSFTAEDLDLKVRAMAKRLVELLPSEECDLLPRPNKRNGA